MLHDIIGAGDSVSCSVGVICMPSIQLMRPSLPYAAEIAAFRQELLDTGSNFSGCGSLCDCPSIEAWIRMVEASETTCAEGSVTSSSYIAVRMSDGKVVGIIDLRHHIDHPILSVWGGHIGYTVRPSERRMGYAKEMLRQNLQHCRDRGLEKVLIVCNADNIASEKTITANGGVFEKEITIDGQLMKRFLVFL